MNKVLPGGYSVIRKSLTQRYLACLCASLLVSLAQAADEPYNYPHHDGYVATVVGTPAADRAVLPKKIPFKGRRIVMFENRHVPDAIWFERELRYSAQ